MTVSRNFQTMLLSPYVCVCARVISYDRTIGRSGFVVNNESYSRGNVTDKRLENEWTVKI